VGRADSRTGQRGHRRRHQRAGGHLELRVHVRLGRRCSTPPSRARIRPPFRPSRWTRRT
jgi:hypothetical protein